jgi:two-component system, cell cycle sensor histidine kinase and response regulator CckA
LAGDLDNIKVDRDQLEQLVLSLLANARAVMVAGGRVALATQNVSLTDGLTSPHLSAPPGRYVMLAVTDEGQGVPDETVPHLFEPFFAATGAGKGAGLGLATFTAS